MTPIIIGLSVFIGAALAMAFCLARIAAISDRRAEEMFREFAGGEE